jgi:membrane protease YdiL (CAAX protease family)
MESLDPAISAVALMFALVLTEGAKQIVPSRYAVFVALAIGALVGLVAGLAGIGDGNVWMDMLSGAAGGLMASGTYSGARALTRG